MSSAVRAERLRRLAGQRLYLVTDDRLEFPLLLERLERALAAGARVVQFRDKRVERGELLRRAEQVQALCARHEALYIVNDAVDVAALLGADGVHVGQGDLPPTAVRRLVGDDALLGLSVSYLEEAERAARDPAVDYLGVGAVYVTGTKPTAEYGGLDLLAAVRTRVALPIVAIGGIDAARARDVFVRGADLVAVVSAVFSPEQPEQVVRELIRLGEQARGPAAS